MRRLAGVPEELLAIGDNPATDGEGARRLGIACVLVGNCAGARFGSLTAMLRSRQAPLPDLANVG